MAAGEDQKIYVLRLRGGKFYVGSTNDVEARFKAHQSGHGSSWTRKYLPRDILEVESCTSPLDEDKKVKEVMLKYGIENVRGGSYSQERLTTHQLRTLQMELKTAKDLCFKCGKGGHYASDCSTDTGACFRCGRTGHWADSCYAKTDVTGVYIDDDDYDDDYDDDDDEDYEY